MNTDESLLSETARGEPRARATRRCTISTFLKATAPAVIAVVAIGLLIVAVRAQAGYSVEKRFSVKLRTGASADFDVAADGTLIVANIASSTVDVYSGKHTYLRSIKPPVDLTDYFRPSAIAFETQERLWVVDGFTGLVMRYMTDGNLLSSFVLETGTAKLSSVAAIAVLAPEKEPEILVTTGESDDDSPETMSVAQAGEPATLPEEKLARAEGRLYALRADGKISAFKLTGEWVYDLAAPDIKVHTPAGLFLDYPLLWSLDYESRRISIYDLERRDAKPGSVSVKTIPDDAPIYGLTGVPGEDLLIVTGGHRTVWMESENGWQCLLNRTPSGSQPPVARAALNSLYLLDRDANQIVAYDLEGRNP